MCTRNLPCPKCGHENVQVRKKVFVYDQHGNRHESPLYICKNCKTPQPLDDDKEWATEYVIGKDGTTAIVTDHGSTYA